MLHCFLALACQIDHPTATPREPYKSEPVSSHANRFDPVTHKPVQNFSKSGYYLDPDFVSPRASKKGTSEVLPDPKNRRFHALSPTLIGATEKASPGEVSSFYSGSKKIYFQRV